MRWAARRDQWAQLGIRFPVCPLCQKRTLRVYPDKLDDSWVLFCRNCRKGGTPPFWWVWLNWQPQDAYLRRLRDFARLALTVEPVESSLQLAGIPGGERFSGTVPPTSLVIVPPDAHNHLARMRWQRASASAPTLAVRHIQYPGVCAGYTLFAPEPVFLSFSLRRGSRKAGVAVYDWTDWTGPLLVTTSWERFRSELVTAARGVGRSSLVYCPADDYWGGDCLPELPGIVLSGEEDAGALALAAATGLPVRRDRLRHWYRWLEEDDERTFLRFWELCTSHLSELELVRIAEQLPKRWTDFSERFVRPRVQPKQRHPDGEVLAPFSVELLGRYGRWVKVRVGTEQSQSLWLPGRKWLTAPLSSVGELLGLPVGERADRKFLPQAKRAFRESQTYPVELVRATKKRLVVAQGVIDWGGVSERRIDYPDWEAVPGKTVPLLSKDRRWLLRYDKQSVMARVLVSLLFFALAGRRPIQIGVWGSGLWRAVQRLLSLWDCLPAGRYAGHRWLYTSPSGLRRGITTVFPLRSRRQLAQLITTTGGYVLAGRRWEAPSQELVTAPASLWEYLPAPGRPEFSHPRQVCRYLDSRIGGHTFQDAASELLFGETPRSIVRLLCATQPEGVEEQPGGFLLDLSCLPLAEENRKRLIQCLSQLSYAAPVGTDGWFVKYQIPNRHQSLVRQCPETGRP